MTQTLFLVLSALAVALGAHNYNALRVKYGFSGAGGADVDYFYTIPRTAREAEVAGWKQFIKPYDSKINGLFMYCLNNLEICSLYNQKGFVTGLQISIPQDKIELVPNMAELKMKPWQAPAAFGEPAKLYWTLPIVFASEESLKTGALPTIENGQILQDGGVWVHGLNNIDMIKMPTSEAELQKTAFKKQNCVPAQGTHYQYNLTPNMKCEDFLPFFGLVHDGQLIGSGFLFFGKFTKNQTNRAWFENPTPARETTIWAQPLAPQCFYDWAEKYHQIAVHIYYIEDPWNIKCKESDSIRKTPKSIMEKIRAANGQ
ncbi:hypothetical protein O0L34_g10973 [Tuta absoluta]|nr:hypothetical protein O0L34_g10973 [Tuta absoluta]